MQIPMMDDHSLLNHLLMKVSYLLPIPRFSGETFLTYADNAPCSKSDVWRFAQMNEHISVRYNHINTNAPDLV
ncbi:unnamed protein product [Trifolium pratense]|uniref:Uncharacterized protein n=1 Tax=Trifolium pratense TaxID=57577 RepID=A0ACB0K1A6_TRIPR|nr:unnamed protein product [Trifolium pratense]